jgi:hypothetical protein
MLNERGSRDSNKFVPVINYLLATYCFCWFTRSQFDPCSREIVLSLLDFSCTLNKALVQTTIFILRNYLGTEKEIHSVPLEYIMHNNNEPGQAEIIYILQSINLL